MIDIPKSLSRLTAVALALVVAGCIATTAKKITVLPTQPVEVSWHNKAALAALIMRLRGASETEVKRQAGAGGAAVIKTEPGFRYDGFAVRQIKIVSAGTIKNDPKHYAIAGYLHFQDAVQRRTAAAFWMEYREGTDGVTILKAPWVPLFSKYPKVEMFVVPAVFSKTTKGEPADYRRLYRSVAENAVSMKDPAAADKEMRNYVIAVFVKDRVAPGAKFEVGISDVRFGAGSFKDQTQYNSTKDGWGFAIVPGRFSLSSAGAFWVKTVYTPGIDVAKDERSTRIVGLFSTVPTKPEAKKPSPPPMAAKLLPTPVAGATAIEKRMDAILKQALGSPAPMILATKAAVNQASLPEVVYRVRAGP